IIVQYVDTNLVNIEDGIFTAGLCGDFDGNGTVLDIADLVYLVEYMFGNPPGPEPVVLSAVDVDGSGEVNIADLVYIVDYMFNFGPPPGCP
ncbi:MAG: hypothetical protein ACE5D6_10080, partial [Candidatus Zixiibacteriota bacterium]